LFIHADTLKILLDSIDKVDQLHAYRHMKFYRNDFQGMSDSMVYIIKDSTVYFYHDPVIWYEENQFKSDEIKLVMQNGNLDSVLFNRNVFLIAQDTIDSNFYNQIKGNSMVGWFKNNSMYKLRVYENSETIYFLWEEDLTPVGMTRISASDMLIFLKNNLLETITYQKEPKAKLYPMHQIPQEELKFNGFIWLDDRRPKKKEDIFIW